MPAMRITISSLPPKGVDDNAHPSTTGGKDIRYTGSEKLAHDAAVWLVVLISGSALRQQYLAQYVCTSMCQLQVRLTSTLAPGRCLTRTFVKHATKVLAS